MGLTIQGSYCDGGQIFRTVRTTQPPIQWVKRKAKVRPITCHEGPRKRRRYSSTHSLTLAVDRSGWLTPLYPRERSGTQCTGGLVCLEAGLDGYRKSIHNGIRTPDHAARSQSLYRPPIYITGIGYFSEKKTRGRDVDHAHQLAPRLKSTAIPLLPLYIHG